MLASAENNHQQQIVDATNEFKNTYMHSDAILKVLNETSPIVFTLLDMLYEKNQFYRIVVDEVHCISQWGYDFRPHYLKLNELRTKYQKVPIMMVSGTSAVLADVIEKLTIHNAKFFMLPLDRPNIRCIVKKKKSNEAAIRDIVKIIAKNNELK